MNYQRIHDGIINRAKSRTLISGYNEIHHIIPRCMGGMDIKENTVKLTAEEHYIIHRLLSKLHPNHYGLLHCISLMYPRCNRIKGMSKNKQYACFKKRKYSIPKPQHIRDKIRKTMTGQKYSDERKLSVSIGTKLAMQNLDIRKKCSESAKRRCKNKEYIQSLSEKTKLNWLNPEMRKKMSENRRGISPEYPLIICNHCGKSGGTNVMKRWHFDNCKFKTLTITG